MYKMTCFAPIEPNQLEQVLKGIRFVKKGSLLEWRIDDHIFSIEPFQNQPRDSLKAYRIQFNSSIQGGLYLYDLSMGSLGAIVTGIEYTLTHEKRRTIDWINELRRRKSFKLIDPRGLYLRHDVNIIAMNDSITLKLHSRKNKNLKLLEALEKVDLIREELTPVEYDLFSFANEEEIA